MATALAVSPPTGMIAPSPGPLTPSGLLGEGWFSRAIARIFTENLKGIISATKIAEEIRARIRAETELTASAGR